MMQELMMKLSMMEKCIMSFCIAYGIMVFFLSYSIGYFIFNKAKVLFL